MRTCVQDIVTHSLCLCQAERFLREYHMDVSIKFATCCYVRLKEVPVLEEEKGEQTRK